MTSIKDVEELVQASYGGFGYEVSRVTGKALIITLPQAGQNFDDLVVELRARGCSVNFETLADESPPKVELTVHPGVHPVVLSDDDDEPDSTPAGVPPANDGIVSDDVFTPARPHGTSRCSAAGWICVMAVVLLLLLFGLAAWQKVAP
tara:strand:+ start:6590 stop:7033 length:444 start_codon:yes stop_codon:yes gene_type:complete